MTEDILFDNIYVGHSLEDAKALAAESFDIKKPLESAKPKDEASDDEEEGSTFAEDPIGFIREKVFEFIDLAKLDPVLAFKTQPETGAALAVALLTAFGMLGALTGIVGGSSKPVPKVRSCHLISLVLLLTIFSQSSKKTDAPTADDKKKTEAAPVAPAGGEKKDENGLKKRAGK
jgi:hypothetical protein